jgi:hypothetical protein
MLPQAPKDGTRDLGARCLGVGPGLDSERPTVNPLEGGQVLLPLRWCFFAHEARQLSLHCPGNPAAVAGVKAMQHELLNVDEDRVTRYHWGVVNLLFGSRLSCPAHVRLDPYLIPIPPFPNP